MALIKQFSPSGDNLNGFVRNYVNTSNNLLKFIPSSSISSFTIDKLLNYTSSSNHWASDYSDGLNSFLKIKVIKFGLVLSHFSIRSHYENVRTMRSWVFEASNDGFRYDVLIKREESDDLNNNAVKLYEVNQMNKVYSIFRVRQTNMTSGSSYNMRVGKIDLFGMLVTREKKCTCLQKNHHLCKFFIAIIQFYICL